MTPTWPSALASVDDSLAVLCDSLEKLEAAEPIDVTEVVRQLRKAVESSQQLRELVLSERPDASWEDRKELEALIEVWSLEQRRSRLLALAAELERGTIAHRRAVRVSQLNRIREQAIQELRTQAELEEAPPTLPGPEANRWVEWACALKEPEDTADLQALRNGFACLDEFVVNLEPGMWTVESPSESPAATQAEAESSFEAKVEEWRSRILALAVELERGTIVHHRAARVTELRQLRDQAVEELRLQAYLGAIQHTLAGPEAEQWVEWACELKEPDDVESLQAIRNGFPHLDEFVAKLEPGMWIAGSKSDSAILPEAERAADSAQQTQVHVAMTDTLDEAPVSSATAEPPLPTQVFREVFLETSSEPGITFRITSGVRGIWAQNWRMLLASAAVLILVVLGAILWRSHRKSASNPSVKSVQAAVPEVAQGNSGSNPSAPSVTSSDSVGRTAAGQQPGNPPKAKNQDPPQPSAAAVPETQTNAINDVALRMPQAIPKNAGIAKAEEAGSGGAPEAPNVVLPNSTPSSLGNIVKSFPIAEPKIATPRIRVSSGVAQGQLVHRVSPQYPESVRLSGVRGTVALEATIGKDGSVQNVHALSGPRQLVQPAMDAVKQWRYKPFSLNGQPAEADIQININFTP